MTEGLLCQTSIQRVSFLGRQRLVKVALLGAHDWLARVASVLLCSAFSFWCRRAAVVTKTLQPPSWRGSCNPLLV